ncbi:DUF6850 family outer membrane beta-barrel protein [Gemmatimonas groenlandica]|uniref:DUF6850 domain-containing protein n=1 Tax=Gemmatimonas groenlandica TaxID=2732249 RepID=A0A6M4IK81_9BACT|nr:DUF6850 family outer membrane beta-barrel protein [Gemmatimonas groenlandica]QJR34269.1 hypothetical protein HKW67_01415 [Gemmatimonas groenlandica]
MIGRRVTGVLVTASIISLAPLSIHAQDVPASGWGRAIDSNSASSAASAAWFGAWSPLRPVLDVPRGLLRAPLAPGLLDAPAPLTGAFVLAGAPGAIVRDFRPWLAGDTAHWSELRMRQSGESGTYKRPLDVADANVTQAIGQGWAPIGSRGVAVGRFILDRERHDATGYSQRVAPYWSSPFIVTDSVTPPMQRTRVRLEGAVGWQVAGFGLGVSAGVESREHNSVNVPLRRSGRAATPAVVLGADRALPWLGLVVGAYYKWSEPNETNVLNAVPLPTIMYQLKGYDEPFGFIVTDANPVFVRNDRQLRATGGTAQLTVLGTRLVVAHEQAQRAEDQYQNFVSGNTPTDRWRATGSTSHLQLSRGVGRLLRATVVASRTKLTGVGTRSDLTGVAIDGGDEASSVEADVRASRGHWMAALLGGFAQRSHARVDYVAERRTALDISTPFVGGEVARQLGRGGLALGASLATRAATGGIPTIPAPQVAPTYRRLLQPELAYEAAQSQAVAGWASVRVPVSSQLLVISARMERASPSTASPTRLQPVGDRTAWSLGVGWQR